MEQSVTATAFDRQMSRVDAPGVLVTKPTTLQANNALLKTPAINPQERDKRGGEIRMFTAMPWHTAEQKAKFAKATAQVEAIRAEADAQIKAIWAAADAQIKAIEAEADAAIKTIRAEEDAQVEAIWAAAA